MRHVHDTWYVLEDGSKADPNDVAPDANGVLRHTSGVAVAMRGSVLHTSGVGPAPTTGAQSGGALADMTVAQLKELAADRSIDLGEATKKADIIAAIEVANNAPVGTDREMKAGGTAKAYETR